MRILDGFINAVSGLGGSLDKSKANGYAVSARPYSDYATMYKESSTARLIVDTKVDDIVREWRDWTDDRVEAEELRLSYRATVEQAIREARTKGGAALMPIFEGDNNKSLKEELDIDSIKVGSLKSVILILADDLEIGRMDESPVSGRYRRPLSYKLTSTEYDDVEIHHSRISVVSGENSVFSRVEVSRFHGDSSLHGLSEIVKGFDSIMGHINHLVHESSVDVIRVDNLASNFETQADEANFIKRWTTAMGLKSSINALLIDKEDEYQSKTLNLSGLMDIAKGHAEALASLSGIPITKFMGASPGGLNATGESDTRNYYDSIASYQNTKLRDSLKLTDKAILASLGADQETEYKWLPLWQVSTKDKAEISKLRAEAAAILSEAGVFDQRFIANLLINLNMDGVSGDIQKVIDDLDDDEGMFAAEIDENADL